MLTALKKKIPFIYIIFVCAAFTGCCNRDTQAEAEVKPRKPDAPKSTKTIHMATCPVCGLSFPIDERAKATIYKGTEYSFFTDDHYREFMRDPDVYHRSSPEP